MNTNDNYPSVILANAVSQMASLPGIGRKTALRLVLHLLHRSEGEVAEFSSAFLTLKKEVHYCRICHNLSDQGVCPICANPRRDRSTICVVENIQDVMSIEQTGQYNGLYHVLGGIINPLEGIGPTDIEVPSLVQRVESEEVKEVILALPTTMEGDTTTFFIYKRLIAATEQGDRVQPLLITQIARGIAIGNDLEYTDEITLGRSIVNRTTYKG